MANTTNYNWETPDDTDLVKDGAAAIRTLGSSIDTTTKNLNPETTTGDIAYRSATANTNTRLAIGSTGQVLTVAAGVPSWASPSDQTPLTTKGDVFTFSTVDARLGVGANGTVLTADSAETTGLKWAAPSSGTAAFVGCIGTRTSGTQSITAATITAITMPSEEIDTDAFHDTSTNTSRFTIPSGKGGKYFINVIAGFNQSVGTYGELYIRLNGSTYTSNGFPASGNYTNTFSGANDIQGNVTMVLSAADYVEVAIRTQAGIDISRVRISLIYLGA
jgi:hypothetical protein